MTYEDTSLCESHRALDAIESTGCRKCWWDKADVEAAAEDACAARLARIDATARELYREALSAYGVSTRCDINDTDRLNELGSAAYYAALMLEDAHARFIASEAK